MKIYALSLKYVLVVTLISALYSNLKGQYIKPIGSPIDFSSANEYAPAISNDGSKMAFVSNKSNRFELYLSKRNESGEWSEPKAIDPINNFKAGIGNIRYPAFNYDGSVIYFEADYTKDSSDFDIFYSVFNNGDWTEPLSIGTPVNSLGYDGQPSISADNNRIYFVRNAVNSNYKGHDCKDIYYSSKNKDGSWNRPIKLPVPINVGCVQAPRISNDNKTIYFSSIRDGGKGGFDIYKSRLITKNIWLPAESIDTLNTFFDDFSPSIAFNSEIGYYSIRQDKKLNFHSGIYSAELPPQFLPAKTLVLKGSIKDQSTKQALDASIDVFDAYTSRILYSFKNENKSGNYYIILPKGNEYLIDYHKKNYSHFLLNENLIKLRANQLVEKNVLLYNKVNLLLNIFDNQLFSPIKAVIVVKNQDSTLVDTNIKEERKGRYVLQLPIGEKYQITVSTDHFETKKFDFDLDQIVQFNEFEKDIELTVKKVDFEIVVSDEATQLGVPVEVVITNLDNNEVIRTTARPDSKGKYKIKLREGDRYNVSVSPKGYSFYNTTVNLRKKKAPKKLEIKLKQLKKDTKLTLNNITFEVNSADLNESSYIELDRVVKLMKDNPLINIEIAAHTDNVGSNIYNLRLSKKRAKSVVDYLTENNIDPQRLLSKGYGEFNPLVPNDSDEHKAMNRRVELKIIKIKEQ